MNERSSKPEPVELPPIPAKRYFTIGEVSDLCGVKPHVLRYWEQEFTHHEVLLIRRIRELLYEQGFTISGARNKLGSRLAEAEPVPDEPVVPPEPQVDLVALRNELLGIMQLLRPQA